MKAKPLLVLSAAVSAMLAAGCSSHRAPGFSTIPPNHTFTQGDNALKISGPPGTRFTASYQSARGSGTIRSATKSNVPSTLFKTPDPDLQADIRKEDSSQPLTVEISRGDRAVFHADVPPGKEGVRVEPEGTSWRAEIY